MRTTIRMTVLGIIAAFASVNSVSYAALYSADAKTVSTDGGSAATSPIAARLFLDNSFASAAPLGTTIWFVADNNNDGVPPINLGSSQVALSTILGADDALLLSDVLDGDQPGSVAGQYRHLAIAVNGSTTANIYAYLWNGTGADFVPADGATFGVEQVTAHPAGDVGNAFWAIGQDMSASEFVIGPVPEPATTGAIAAGLLAVAVAARKLFERRAGARG